MHMSIFPSMASCSISLKPILSLGMCIVGIKIRRWGSLGLLLLVWTIPSRVVLFSEIVWSTSIVVAGGKLLSSSMFDVVSRSIALLSECPSSPMFSCLSTLHILPNLANVLLLGLVVVFNIVDLLCSFMLFLS